MNDFAVRSPANDAEPPGGFQVGAVVRMNYRVMGVADGGEETALDLTAGRFTVRVRAWRRGATTFLRDELCTASVAGGADGYFDHDFKCGANAYTSALNWEFVLVDAANADTASKTQKREHVLLAWHAAIAAAPVSGP